jgi:phenylalanyl-tRNA synthetase alpha chain
MKITTIPVEQKKYGAEMNKAKNGIIQKIDDRRKELLETADKTESVDITMPGTSYPHGSLHLVTYAVEEISRIFNHIGFIRITYPGVEWEYYSFDSLNMPKDHPGRDDFETFFYGTPDPTLGK